MPDYNAGLSQPRNGHVIAHPAEPSQLPQGAPALVRSHIVLTRTQLAYFQHVVRSCWTAVDGGMQPKTIRSLFDAYEPPVGHVRPSEQVVRNMIVKLADMGLLVRIDSPTASGRPFHYMPTSAGLGAYNAHVTAEAQPGELPVVERG